MIEVYPSRLSDEGKEVYATTGRTSVIEWLLANGISQNADFDSLPMSVYVNGDRLLPSEWALTFFTPEDRVEIYREPKGTDPFSITFALVFGAKAVISALMPKLPTTNSNRSQGNELDEASSKGNKVKLNSLKAECAGLVPERFGDYALPARRYFTSDPREQRVEMLLFIGKGRYQKLPTRVKTGQTPLLSLGNDARFAFYEPGADLSAEPAHLNWYPAPEVGASSSGAAGLELTTTFPLTFSATATAFRFSGKNVIIPSGSGSFPADWVNGLVLRIGAPYPYTVVDGGGAGGRDVIQGDITSLGLVAGDVIEIAGDNAGFYVVHSADATNLQLNYAGGAPATGLVIGNTTSTISFSGLKFKMEAAIAISGETVAGPVVGIDMK